MDALTPGAEQFVQSLKFDECQPTVEEDSIVRLAWSSVVLGFVADCGWGRLRRSRFEFGSVDRWTGFVRSFVACRLPGMAPVDGPFVCCLLLYLCLLRDILYLTQIAVGVGVVCVCETHVELQRPDQTRPDQTRPDQIKVDGD